MKATLPLITAAIFSNRGRHTGRVLFVVAIATSILTSASLSVSASELFGQASVIDADTLVVDGQRIHLRGVEAVGRHQTCRAYGIEYLCGLHAIFELSNFLGQDSIVCQTLNAKGEGEVSAVCRLNGQDVGAWLVQRGWALPHGEGASEYAAFEKDAKRNKRGIWAGSF